MNTSSAPTPSLLEKRSPFLLLEYVAAFGVTYWSNFIWFYLDKRWHPRPSTNLLINAGFGFFYMIGCLLLPRLGRSLSMRGMLILSYILLIGITTASGIVPTLEMQILVMFAHALVVSLTWPNLETLAAGGLHGGDLGRMVSLYNIGWAGTSAFTVAVSGWFYGHVHHATPFAIPCVFMAFAILLVIRHVPVAGLKFETAATPHEPGHSQELERVSQTLAEGMRHLARTGNLGSYLMLSVLIPLMPEICHRLNLGIAQATAFASVWLIVRVPTFVVLGRWHGWHFRIDYFLAAVVAMPLMFAVIMYSSSVAVSLLAQIIMGAAIGLVYTSALFYSLHGDHGTDGAAAHEAVIGAGIMSGPLVAGLVGLACSRLGLSQNDPIIAIICAILLAMLGHMMLKARGILRARA